MRANVTAPIVVELGKTRRGDIDELHEGVGCLADDIHAVMNELRSNGHSDDGNRIFVPIVAIYSRDPSRKARALGDLFLNLWHPRRLRRGKR